MAAIVELRQITKTFGKLVANDHIDLKVEEGTVHALIGENGAGKSTLMNILTDIYKADSGEILLNGKPIMFKDPMDAVAHGIGMVYQEFMLFPQLTVLDNIMMGFEKRKAQIFIDAAKSRAAIEDICKAYQFNIQLDAYVKDLPVAMRQQVEIVKVLYKGAKIIILDEPTSVLTPQGIQGLFNAIRYLKSTGITIIFITHKLKEVLEIADAITVLKDGRVTGNVLPADVDETKLASMMVGRDVLLTAPTMEKTIGAPLLQVEHLRVNDMHDVERVKDVSFTVHAGEIVGIAGVAGSGQREMVESLFGLSHAKAGSKIVLHGKDITNESPREHRLLGIGYIPQDRMGVGANPASSIWENSIMGYHVKHGFKSKFLIDRRQANTFTEQIIKEYSVKTQGVSELIGSLSGGNIQKVVVGREFSQDYVFLIIEDPTRGIDIGSIEFIWKKIIEIAAQGVGILLVSHELNEVMELSDRILVMFDGKLADGGTKHEKSETQLGLLMMGGEQHETIAE